MSNGIILAGLLISLKLGLYPGFNAILHSFITHDLAEAIYPRTRIVVLSRFYSGYEDKQQAPKPLHQ